MDEERLRGWVADRDDPDRKLRPSRRLAAVSRRLTSGCIRDAGAKLLTGHSALFPRSFNGIHLTGPLAKGPPR